MGEPEVPDFPPTFLGRLKRNIKRLVSGVAFWVKSKVTAIAKWFCKKGKWLGFVLMAIGFLLQFTKNSWLEKIGLVLFVVGVAIFICYWWSRSSE